MDQGTDLTIIPVRPSGEIFHQDGFCLLSRTVAIPLWGWRVLVAAVFWLLKSPLKVFKLLFLVLAKGTISSRLKNFLVFPKGLFVASVVLQRRADHIHAHWATTPATCAMMASFLTGVQWSFTAHRWDLVNNNLLAEKVNRCSFVRVISQWGFKQIIRIADVATTAKVALIPMGVIPSEAFSFRSLAGRPVLAAVGSLTPIKGHRFLLEACKLLVDQGIDFQCLIIGDGPERLALSRMIQEFDMDHAVTLAGTWPHHEVLCLLQSGGVHILVHPSIEAPGGGFEGVPVAVMEAMAHGIPVIVTNTGSLSDLVDGQTGTVIPPEDPVSLALAVKRLLDNPRLAGELAEAAYHRVCAEFSLKRSVSALLQWVNHVQ